ncbi:hypothetical protein [Spirillospora sp. NPDC048823]|uniref:hypothetical protein n=1 Tax=unclassified Spirillospora TaxID=2642701 RepID=UPI0037199445
MHQVFRGVARIAAIAALTVSGGALVAVPAAMADLGADMGLVCSGKAGTHKVTLRIETTVPSSGAVGQPIQLGTIKVDVGLPPELLKEVSATSPNGASTPPVTGLAPSPAASTAIGGVAEIQVAVHEPGGDRRGGWPAFALAAAPARGDGAVHLTGSGVAPPVVPGSPGGLSWSAREMALSLVPGDTTTGKDTAELALHCVTEKEAVLGTVRVGRARGASAPGASSAPTRQAAAAQEGLCKVIPGRGEDPRYAINYDPELELAEIYESPPTPSSIFPRYGAGLMYCIKATGFFNIKKVGNAAPIAVENNARALTESYVGNGFFGPNYQEYRGYFVNRTYPTPATMLGFGFMPTRAVANAVQIGAPGGGEADPITGNLRILQRLRWDMALPDPTVKRQEIAASAYIRIKAGQAEVNGVPLDLGDECMTGPTLLSANGFMGNERTGTTQYYEGQPLIAEDVEIPPFSGCGVTEDLSPILTASVSGGGNYANLESGRWCNILANNQCVNGAGPLPEKFTVYPGGDVTAVAEPFVLTKNDTSGRFQGQFRCDSATMRLQMDRGHWQSRFRLGKGDMSLDGCEVEASDRSVYPVVGEATQDGSLWLNMFTDVGGGNPQMKINGVVLNATVDVGEGKKCSLRIGDAVLDSIFNPVAKYERPGEIIGTYSNGVFSMKSQTLRPTVKSTCQIPGFNFMNFADAFTLQEGNFAFSPEQQITSP